MLTLYTTPVVYLYLDRANTGVRSSARGAHGEPCKVPDATRVLGVVVQTTCGFPQARDTIPLYQEPDSL